MSLLQYLDTFLSSFMYLNSQLLLTLSTKFIGKHLRWSRFYNKAAGWKPVTLLNTQSGTTLLLWRNFAIGLESSWSCKIGSFLRIHLSCCLWKHPSRQKHVQSQQKINVSGMLLGCLYDWAWRIFLKSVAESGFCKSSGLYINNSDGILLLVKLQDFNINDSERVTDRACF